MRIPSAGITVQQVMNHAALTRHFRAICAELRKQPDGSMESWHMPTARQCFDIFKPFAWDVARRFGAEPMLDTLHDRIVCPFVFEGHNYALLFGMDRRRNFFWAQLDYER